MRRTPIAGFDHPVIAVRDMNESRQRYERMGFFVPPRGSHREWGTGNWCIMFPPDYLELRGILDPDRYTHKLDAFLAKREGLMGIAFAGDCDNHEALRILRERGLDPQPVRELTRRFELPEGEVEPSFRLLFFREGETGPMMASLICQHLTPDLIRQPEFLSHPNGVNAIVSMTSVSDELEGSAELLSKYFGACAVERHARALTVHVGRDATLWILTPGEAAKQGLELDAEAPYLASIQMRTTSLDACEAALTGGHVPFTRQRGLVRVPAAAACGVTLEFMQG